MSRLLSEEQFASAKRIVAKGIEHGNDALARNELAFLDDMEKRLEMFQRSTFISDKQWAWLESIQERLIELLGADYHDD